jgi:hypothetical protein
MAVVERSVAVPSAYLVYRSKHDSAIKPGLSVHVFFPVRRNDPFEILSWQWEGGRPVRDRTTGEALVTASASAEQHLCVHMAVGAVDFPLDPIERLVPHLCVCSEPKNDC